MEVFGGVNQCLMSLWVTQNIGLNGPVLSLRGWGGSHVGKYTLFNRQTSPVDAQNCRRKGTWWSSH